jgi:CubicO group peptidase (beta-lactamase class C family)
VSPNLSAARRLVAEGVEAGAYPAAVVEAGRRGGPVWREAFGRLTYAGDAPVTRLDTMFDLASLTKVIATTSAALRAVSDGLVDLDDPIARHAATWAGPERAAVTLRHLFDHSSGLPAYAELWRDHRGREAYEAAICATPLSYAPGSASVYSDLGFMLAGLILERVATRTLDVLLAERVAGLDDVPRDEGLTYRPPASSWSRIAPTEEDPWRGRLLAGEVHDENAWALGGVAAHAGMFGTAGAVGAFARRVMETFDADTPLGRAAVMRRFAARTGVPGSSRAIGWDTMRPTSSCGRLLSPSAIGHTGFTGTSLWIDHEADLYIVLLTNRVHPTRRNERLTALRPMIHDAIARVLRNVRGA